MTRQRLILAAVAIVAGVLVVVPVAWAASDLYANLGPGGSTGPLADRYPLGNYVLDSHFSAVKASLVGGIDASGVPAMIAFFLANLLWQITAFCATAMISIFALAFSLDLVNGSTATAGAGALAPVADAIHHLYAHTLGQPWTQLAIVLAGCWAMWRALIQRRFTETASTLGLSLIFCLIAMAIVTRPDATIGQASRWTNRISAAFLSVSAHGRLTNGPAARRAASDQLFGLLVLRPWVALEFGGTEHCIRAGTGNHDHDPQSVPVRPLATSPQADAASRTRLQRTGHIRTATKECVDNTVRYPDHFLAFAPGSEDRDAEYDAINNADPSKVPDSDPTHNSYRPAVVDKPATDAMEQGGQYQRLLLALVILIGELGALLLLGSLCVSVLLAQIVVLLLAAFSPVALVAAIVPGRGHQLFRTWAGQLATYLVRKAAYSLVLAVLLAVLAALQDATANLGWLLSFALQTMLLWMVFLHRHKLAGQLVATVSGQQPAREASLRKLLGVAYVARAVTPARRRRPPTRPTGGDPDTPAPDTGPAPAPDTEPAAPAPNPDGATTPPVAPVPSDAGSALAAGRAHGRPSPRRDHGTGTRRPATQDTEPVDRGGEPRGGDDEQAQVARGRRARRHAARPADAVSDDSRVARRPRPAPRDERSHSAGEDEPAAAPAGRERSSRRPVAPSPPAVQRAELAPDDLPSRPGAGQPPSPADELRADRARHHQQQPDHDAPPADDDGGSPA